MSDVFHEEIYEHANGKKYHVEWSYDHHFGAPDHENDGHGVIVELPFDPSDEDEVESHFEYNFDDDDEDMLKERARLSLMRVLRYRQGRYDNTMCYDVFATLEIAKRDGWGVSKEWEAAHPDATENDKLMHAINQDFDYLEGWYDDKWHWCTVGVAPLDKDGEPDEDHREYCGGYESTILDTEHKKWHDEVVEDRIHDVEWALRKELHKDQMELELVIA
jgi:hypothetical protein